MHLARIVTLFFLVLSSTPPTPGTSKGYFQIPARVQTAFLIKLLSMNQDLEGRITIAVLKDRSIAETLKTLTGRPINSKATLGNVELWNEIEQNRPHVLFIASETDLEEALRFTREKKILSVTGLAHLAQKGVTLGIVGHEGKPKVLLNRNSSEKEGIRWNQAIFKMTEAVGS